MSADSRKIPTHETVYARLRDMILFGHLEPGTAITIQGLVADLGVGMTPVREAIRRLTAEGAIEPQGNRRVSVPRMSGAMLDQVAFARQTIEPRLAEMATANMTAQMIEALEQIDQRVNAAIQSDDISGYLEANHAFHFYLYEASQAPVLVDMARSMWLRFGPALRVVVESHGTPGLADHHALALTALREGNARAVAAALRSDIADGITLVQKALQKS
jgi:DNA-binding GntR family transcriptional regulator